MPLSSGNILVVDDEFISREMLAHLLGGHQYVVTVAEDGPQALASFDELVPDLVLLDVTIPGMDGLEVLRQLRSRFPATDLPVIMVTADGQSESVVKAFEFGANDYITKPIDAPVILARIATQIGFKRTLNQLRESEERYALAARGANDGLWDWDVPGEELYLSPRWKEMVGAREEDIGTRPDEWFHRIHKDDRQPLFDRLHAHWRGMTPHFEMEFRMEHRDGSYRWMLCRGLALRGRDGHATRMAGSLSDITESKVADALTGLPNRILFLDRLERAIEHRRRKKNHFFAVLFLDVDRFKLVNDSLGHDVGDQLLLGIARRLEASLRSSDTIMRMSWEPTVARLGGDEFCVLLDGISQAEDLHPIVERLIKEIALPYKLRGHDVFASVSIGVSLSPSGSVTAEEMLREADIAMYHAKTQGRRQYRIFDPAMRVRAVERMELETALQHAVDHDEFVLHYQPMIELDSGRQIGFEALVRWHHPQRGLIYPNEFITVAEETGLIVPIGWWALREACRQVITWMSDRPDDSTPFVSVNCSSRQLAESDFTDRIESILMEEGVPARLLKLEITESILLENQETAYRVLNRLRDIGVRIAIDDFGTGYSSLSYLHNLPIDVLKIDRSFVAKMGRADDGNEIVRTIIALAHGLGLSVVAEGVENQRQLEQLRKLGCEYGQGYLFSAAVSSADSLADFSRPVAEAIPVLG